MLPAGQDREAIEQQGTLMQIVATTLVEGDRVLDTAVIAEHAREPEPRPPRQWAPGFGAGSESPDVVSRLTLRWDAYLSEYVRIPV